MNLDVIDIHCHIFPPLAGAGGFTDAATHLLHQQRAMHVHGNQPYRRTRDHTVLSERPLWDAQDASENGRNTDCEFRVGRCGRFEWGRGASEGYVQFLPPTLREMECAPEVVVRQMEYAGIATAVLQNDHIYGNLAEYFAQASRDYPGRFLGLAQVEEGFADQDLELERVADQFDRLGMRGLYYTTTGLFRNGYRRKPDDPAFDRLWALVAQRDVPVFWVHSAKSPIGDYADEMRHLARIVEKHPSIRHVLVHGVPTSLYAQPNGSLALPAVLTELLDSGRVSAEILYPIGVGGRQEYPYTACLTPIRHLLDRFGAQRFAWGSDAPNVERYCTYRQSLSYLWNHADFLSDQDRRRIFRDNALALFARPAA
ncbi:MAG: amidohydrolase family protein [Burkholderiaceae bacterium]